MAMWPPRASRTKVSEFDHREDLTEIRSAGNKYEIISAWLLEGLAVTISREKWNILSLNRKCATRLLPAPGILP